MFDFHLHLARLPQPMELARLLAEREYRYVAVACEPWEWEAVNKLCVAGVNRTADMNCAAYGVHPMIAGNVTEADFAKLREILESDPDAQVGEAGLDRRFPGYEDGSIQEQVFVRQIKLALELGRDLQIHCVGDYGRVVALLKKNGFGKSHGTAPSTSLSTPLSTSLSTSRPIFHRFGGDAGIVRAALPLGALFSLHNDSFRKKSTVAAIPLIPADSVRFETDADEIYCKACAVPTSAVPAKEITEALIKDLGEVKRLYELAVKGA